VAALAYAHSDILIESANNGAGATKLITIRRRISWVLLFQLFFQRTYFLSILNFMWICSVILRCYAGGIMPS